MRLLWLILTIILYVACQPNNNQTNPVDLRPPSHKIIFPEILSDALRTHDPQGHWTSMRTLEFDLSQDGNLEHYEVDLQSRKVRIKSEQYTVGYDGDHVWITPGISALKSGNPRFYHNLNFYFFAMPFVLADPGLNYKVLPERLVKGKNYRSLRVGFQRNIGDSPDDTYVGLFDVETNQLEYLLYTVTYFDGKKSNRYYGCQYTSWEKINGLLVPETITYLDYTAGSFGKLRYLKTLSHIKLSAHPLNPNIFRKPDGAEVDSLIRNQYNG